MNIYKVLTQTAEQPPVDRFPHLDIVPPPTPSAISPPTSPALTSSSSSISSSSSSSNNCKVANGVNNEANSKPAKKIVSMLLNVDDNIKAYH